MSQGGIMRIHAELNLTGDQHYSFDSWIRVRDCTRAAAQAWRAVLQYEGKRNRTWPYGLLSNY